TLTLPSYCKTGSGSITWCTRNVATSRYALYRVAGATCTGGVKWADYLAPSSSAAVCSGALCIFTYIGHSASSLAKLHVESAVNSSMAILSLPTNNALDPNTLPNCTTSATKYTDPTAIQTSTSTWLHSTYGSGTVDYCGTLIRQSALWYLTSIGNMRNPNK